MPHQCTSCDRLLPSGSREMLGGCPRCGGNRFQYLPGDVDEPTSPTEPSPSEDAPSDEPTGRASATDGGELIIASEVEPPDSDASTGQSDTDPAPAPDRPEGTAQAAARSSIIDPSELPTTTTSQPPEDPAPPEPESMDVPIEELTEELEDTFGSIKIVERGEYELNLLELYENDACIIQLEEDGRYVIDVPDMFDGPPTRK